MINFNSRDSRGFLIYFLHIFKLIKTQEHFISGFSQIFVSSDSGERAVKAQVSGRASEEDGL